MEQVIQQQDSVSVEVTRSAATKDLPARYGWKIHVTAYDQTGEGVTGQNEGDGVLSMLEHIDKKLRERYGEQS